MINNSSSYTSNRTIFKSTKEKFAPNPTTQTQANSNANSYANSFKSYDFLNTAPLDRTKLYGSLSLNNIEDVIKNMTEPPQKFYKTQMQLNDYQDIIS
jgi:hypothetical protein